MESPRKGSGKMTDYLQVGIFSTLDAQYVWSVPTWGAFSVGESALMNSGARTNMASKLIDIVEKPPSANMTGNRSSGHSYPGFLRLLLIWIF